MANGVIRQFWSYDFLGKAVPGLVAFLGVVSLLPTDSPLLLAPSKITVTSVAAFIILAVGIGVLLGEGVHNIAIIIESIVAWFTSVAGELADVGRTSVNDIQSGLFSNEQSDHPREGDDELNDEEGGDELDDSDETVYVVADKVSSEPLAVPPEDEERGQFPFSDVYPSDVFARCLGWVLRRKDGIHNALKTHRDLTEEKIISQLDPYQDPRDRSELPYQHFIESAQTEFGIGMGDFENIKELYPSIASRLEAADITRAQAFQARYAFCRSMWVTLGTFTMIYSVLLAHQFHRRLTSAIPEIPRTFESIASSHTLFFAAAGAIFLSWVSSYMYEKYRTAGRSRPGFYRIAIFGVGSFVVFALFLVLFPQPLMIIASIIGKGVEGALWIFVEWSDGAVSFAGTVRGDEISVSKLVFFHAFRSIYAEAIISLAFATLAFFNASGDYKEYYVQYLVADFNTMSNIGTSSRDSHSEDGEEDEDTNGGEDGDPGGQNNGVD